VACTSQSLDGMFASTSIQAPLPLSTLAIAGRAGHAFTPQAMMQGYLCHSRGVELAAAGPSRVHARVRSKRVHDVLLRAEHGRLSIGCTCPARSLGLDFCKHAWAALLEVDRQDMLSDLRTTRGPLVVEASPTRPEPPSGTHDAPPDAPRSSKQVSAPRRKAKTAPPAKTDIAPTSEKRKPARRSKEPPAPAKAKKPAKPKPAKSKRRAAR
jgi:hypothetical protein